MRACSDVELMWDQMYRYVVTYRHPLSRALDADSIPLSTAHPLLWTRSATVNYGRKGLPVQALSAVDIAIWDLLGKLRNEPVYALLGGKSKDRLPVYW